LVIGSKPKLSINLDEILTCEVFDAGWRFSRLWCVKLILRHMTVPLYIIPTNPLTPDQYLNANGLETDNLCKVINSLRAKQSIAVSKNPYQRVTAQSKEPNLSQRDANISPWVYYEANKPSTSQLQPQKYFFAVVIAIGVMGLWFLMLALLFGGIHIEMH
jgi:hypothetical protein